MNLTIWVHPKAFGFSDFQTAQGVCELTRDALKDILILNITNNVALRLETEFEDETDIEDIFRIEGETDIEDITSIEVEGKFMNDSKLIETGDVEEDCVDVDIDVFGEGCWKDSSETEGEGENIIDELFDNIDVINKETGTKLESKLSSTACLSNIQFLGYGQHNEVAPTHWHLQPRHLHRRAAP